MEMSVVSAAQIVKPPFSLWLTTNKSVVAISRKDAGTIMYLKSSGEVYFKEDTDKERKTLDYQAQEFMHVWGLFGKI